MSRRPRLRRERGIALPVAMMTVVLIGVFSAVLGSAAVQLSDTSNDDRDAKRALGAAEAGLNTAVDRLNGVLPPDSRCLADGPVEVLAEAHVFVRATARFRVEAGQCQPSSLERTGNGGHFYYFVSPVLSAGANGCNDPIGVGGGVPRTSLLASGLTVLQRCVTAVGVVNGEERRVQRRAYSTLQLFNGVTGLARIEARGEEGEDDDEEGGTSLGATQLNTNRLVRLEELLFAGQIVRHRNSDPAEVDDDVEGAWTEQTTDVPWVLAPIEPELATEQYAGGGIGCVQAPGATPCNPVANRVLTVRAGQTVTLSGGTYAFCEVRVEGGTLRVSAPASVFVDHPAREPDATTPATEDHCRSGAGMGKGRLRITGGSVNPAGELAPADVAPNLRFYVYGGEDVTIKGVAPNAVNAMVYAARAKAAVAKGAGRGTGLTFTGSLAAEEIDIEDTVTVAGLASLQLALEPASLLPLYVPGDWAECERHFTNGMPHSGCRG